MRGKLVSALLLVMLLAVQPAAWANDTALGSVGGTVRAVSGGDIRLDSETVQLVAYQRFAEVRVDFKFVNDGAKRKVKLGFPFERTGADSPVSPEAGFRAWKDGEPLAVEAVTGKDGDDEVLYYVHEAEFASGPSMVTVTYLASPTESSGGGTEALPEEWKGYQGDVSAFDYWVHTGAGWKGTIRRSYVRFAFSEDFLGVALGRKVHDYSRGLSPSGVQRPDARTFVWDLRDYEPTRDHDMHVPFVRPMTYEPEKAKRMPVTETTASSHLKLDEQHDYLPYNATDGSPWTAWAEGVASAGKGEWVKATFGSPRRVREIRVLPGYQKRPDLFAKYNRPKTLKVTFSDGTVTTLKLADAMGVQRFPVDVKAGWAKVEIGDVYHGTVRDETYLSGIEFGSAPAPRFATYEQLMGIEAPAATGSGSVTATFGGAAETTTRATAASARRGGVQTYSDARSLMLAAAAGCILLAAVVGAYLLARRTAG